MRARGTEQGHTLVEWAFAFVLACGAAAVGAATVVAVVKVFTGVFA